MEDAELLDISKRQRTLFARLKLCLIVFWVAVGLLFLPLKIDAVWGIALIAIVISKLVFLYYIGCLAVEAKKSRVLWILGSLVGFPLGMLFAYVRMRHIAIENQWI
jgi:hypothetical protein